MPQIRCAIPNENWQIVLEFDEPGFRLFSVSAAREEKGYSFLAYPDKLKNLTHDAAAVSWGKNGSLEAGYLYRKSRPISGPELRRQWLRVGYMNQAPTPVHPSHHVYEVGIRPFSCDEPFALTKSIHGGFLDSGGSLGFSLEGLLRHPGWKRHFELSGCAWAIEVIKWEPPNSGAVLERLVNEVCRRAGEGGAAQKQRPA